MKSHLASRHELIAYSLPASLSFMNSNWSRNQIDRYARIPKTRSTYFELGGALADDQIDFDFEVVAADGQQFLLLVVESFQSADPIFVFGLDVVCRSI